VKTLVLDSHPLIKYFERDEGWEDVADLLQQASEEKCRLLLSVVNWGEIYYITHREYGEEHAEKVLHALRQMPVEIRPADEEMTLEAARLKVSGGLSYADCFAAALAKKKKCELVTGDKEFKQVEKEVKIRWIK
jgi:predicted nucleic acid-binding protein